MSIGHVHNHGHVHRHAAAGFAFAQKSNTVTRTARTAQDAFVDGAAKVNGQPKKDDAFYIDWVKNNLPSAEYAQHLNGPDGQPSAQRARNVYEFMNFYADALAEYGVDLKKDVNAWKDMTWHTLHAFMEEAATFSGAASFDFLGKRLTVRGEGTAPPNDEQIKKFMGHFFHISGHVTARPEVQQALEANKDKLQAQGIDPQKPGNLIYWGSASGEVAASQAKVASLSTGDSSYNPDIQDLSSTGAKIAPLSTGDSSYNPQISDLDSSAVEELKSAHTADDSEGVDSSAGSESVDGDLKTVLQQLNQLLSDFLSKLKELFSARS